MMNFHEYVIFVIVVKVNFVLILCWGHVFCIKKEKHIMVDDNTRKSLSGIPLLQTRAGPREKDVWPKRLKEEYVSLIKYVQNNKDTGTDWFRLESNKEGTKWFGKCWYIHNLLKYEFEVEFDVRILSIFFLNKHLNSSHIFKDSSNVSNHSP